MDNSQKLIALARMGIASSIAGGELTVHSDLKSPSEKKLKEAYREYEEELAKQKTEPSEAEKLKIRLDTLEDRIKQLEGR